MSSSLKWNGDAITKKMRAAVKSGMNATMADCVVHAKNNHTWKNDQHTLEPSIAVAEYAHDVPGGAKGVWGSQDVEYALIHELGGVIVPVRAKALAIPQPDGSVRMVQSVTIPARPYLRPAADAQYPNLVKNIRKAFEQRS